MKDIRDIFELVEGLLPSKAKKTVFYCEVEDGAYEIFYYTCLKNDICKQCYELVEEGMAEEGLLDAGFERIADFIRKTECFDAQKRNVITLSVDGMNETVHIDHFDKSVGLYKIKKEWKLKYVSDSLGK